MSGCNLMNLKEFIKILPSGKIENPHELSEKLALCWDELDGADEESMSGYKLIGRMENVKWKWPVLSFTIERHGGTVLGSTRADLHRWWVDLENDTATVDPRHSYRQVVSRDEPVFTTSLAEEIVEHILAGTEDPRLKWLDGKRRVRVYLSGCFPKSPYQRTTDGRTSRLRKALRELLKDIGWVDEGRPTCAIFERKESVPSNDP